MKSLIPSREITPEEYYFSRRRFVKRILTAATASLVTGACQPMLSEKDQNTAETMISDPPISNYFDELGNPVTGYQDIISYTNFYEFSTDKSAPTKLAQDFKSSPWVIQVGGLVNKPSTLDIDDLLKNIDQEERIYRMRCVEGWSMVIPWIGFPLKKLLLLVEPLSDAKYVRFETIFDPEQMPGQSNSLYPWPYVEGLRMDEAMYDLTLISTGIYGKNLTPQNGAPIRLVVPWKYGFKSIKSITKIDLVDEMPKSLWMNVGPTEYGFFANVNPEVPHPRWSQSSERRIGQSERIETMLFNGYQNEVAPLYNGMDLSVYY